MNLNRSLSPSIFVVLILVSMFFECIQEETKAYSSYFRHPLCQPSDDFRCPTNSAEVSDIVKEAIRRGVTVKAFGQRHSTTDIICTEGIPIDMRKLTTAKMNSDNTATFGAGLNVHEASNFLLKRKRAFKVIPTFGNITLGGAIGTGAHGSSMKFPSSLSAQVAKMTIVNGLGQIQEISDPEDLNSFKVHLGLLGIIVDITMYTLPIYKVKTHNYIVLDEVLMNGTAIEWARTSDEITLVWFPALNEVIVYNRTFVDATTPGNAQGNVLSTSTPEEAAFNRMYKEVAFNLSAHDCQEASALGTVTQLYHKEVFGSVGNIEFLGTKMQHVFELLIMTYAVKKAACDASNEIYSQNVGYPHEMLASTCTRDPEMGRMCSWLHPEPDAQLSIDIEFACDIKDLPAAAATIKDIVNKTPFAFPVIGILFRFSANSDIYMATSYKRDTVHIEFFQWERQDRYNEASGNLAGQQTILQALTNKFGGRSHWGKSGLVYHSRPMLDLKLDKYARSKFIAAMKKFDPNNIFSNNFGRRLTYKDTKIDIDPLTTRCALLDNCFCSKDSDCVATQICTTICGYNYKVCESKNVGPPESFNRTEFENNFNITEWFNNEIPDLINSLKC